MNFSDDLKDYELMGGEERVGRHTLGIKIFVRDSRRVASWAAGGEGLSEMERTAIYDARDNILRAIETTSAMLDPELPNRRAKERGTFRDVFLNAGLTPIHMKALPNGYCSEPCCISIPWFRVTSQVGPVTIGWRKRVINIDWSESDVTANGNDLFAAEGVTTGERYVHAYSEKKAAEYLKALLGALS